MNINNLPVSLQSYIESINDISKDIKNNIIFINVSYNAINFDKVKDDFASKKDIENIKSNDALYINQNGELFFIEFKNSSLYIVSNKNIKVNKPLFSKLELKIYDSIYLLKNLKTNLLIDKSNINYILVYNSRKNSKLKIKLHQYKKSNKNTDGLFPFKRKFELFILNKAYFMNEVEFQQYQY